MSEGAITPYGVKALCERQWERGQVVNAHAPAEWWLEFMSGFGYRLTTTPPYVEGEDHDWGEQAFYADDDN